MQRCLPRFALHFCRSVCCSTLSLVLGTSLRQVMQPGPLWFGFLFFSFFFSGGWGVNSAGSEERHLDILYPPALAPSHASLMVYSVSAASEVWRRDMWLRASSRGKGGRPEPCGLIGAHMGVREMEKRESSSKTAERKRRGEVPASSCSLSNRGWGGS